MKLSKTKDGVQITDLEELPWLYDKKWSRDYWHEMQATSIEWSPEDGWVVSFKLPNEFPMSVPLRQTFASIEELRKEIGVERPVGQTEVINGRP